VADFAVTNPDQVYQSIARKVREIDGLGAVREHQPRSPLIVERRRNTLAWSESFLSQRGMPPQGRVFGDEHVRESVAGQIDEPQVRVAPIHAGQGAERPERVPAAI